MTKTKKKELRQTTLFEFTKNLIPVNSKKAPKDFFENLNRREQLPDMQPGQVKQPIPTNFNRQGPLNLGGVDIAKQQQTLLDVPSSPVLLKEIEESSCLDDIFEQDDGGLFNSQAMPDIPETPKSSRQVESEDLGQSLELFNSNITPLKTYLTVDSSPKLFSSPEIFRSPEIRKYVNVSSPLAPIPERSGEQTPRVMINTRLSSPTTVPSATKPKKKHPKSDVIDLTSPRTMITPEVKNRFMSKSASLKRRKPLEVISLVDDDSDDEGLPPQRRKSIALPIGRGNSKKLAKPAPKEPEKGKSDTEIESEKEDISLIQKRMQVRKALFPDAAPQSPEFAIKGFGIPTNTGQTNNVNTEDEDSPPGFVNLNVLKERGECLGTMENYFNQFDFKPKRSNSKSTEPSKPKPKYSKPNYRRSKPKCKSLS